MARVAAANALFVTASDLPIDILNRLHSEEAPPYELSLLRLLCNARDSLNNTPLHEASRHGNREVVVFLCNETKGGSNVGS